MADINFSVFEDEKDLPPGWFLHRITQAGPLLIPVRESLELGRRQLGGASRVSRRHAQLTLLDCRRLLLQDLGSQYGTYVNDKRIDRGKILEECDVISLGRSGPAGSSVYGCLLRYNPGSPVVEQDDPAPEEDADGDRPVHNPVEESSDSDDSDDTLPEAGRTESEDTVPETRRTDSEDTVPEAGRADSEDTVPDAEMTDSDETVPEAGRTDSEDTVPEAGRADSEDTVPDAEGTDSDDTVPDAGRTDSEDTIPMAESTDSDATIPDAGRTSAKGGGGERLPTVTPRAKKDCPVRLCVKDLVSSVTREENSSERVRKKRPVGLRRSASAPDGKGGPPEVIVISSDDEDVSASAVRGSTSENKTPSKKPRRGHSRTGSGRRKSETVRRAEREAEPCYVVISDDDDDDEAKEDAGRNDTPMPPVFLPFGLPPPSPSPPPNASAETDRGLLTSAERASGPEEPREGNSSQTPTGEENPRDPPTPPNASGILAELSFKWRLQNLPKMLPTEPLPMMRFKRRGELPNETLQLLGLDMSREPSFVPRTSKKRRRKVRRTPGVKAKVMRQYGYRVPMAGGGSDVRMSR